MKLQIREMTLCALCTALLAVSAFIQIPLPYLDYFTLQFLVVLLSGFLLGSRLGTLSVVLYVFIGLLGIPVFAAGGGLGYIVQPSFGYLIGFICAAYLCGKLAEVLPDWGWKRYVIASLAGFLITYIIGLSYKYAIYQFYIGQPLSWEIILLSCFPIDIPCDLILCFSASLIAYRLQNMSIIREGNILC